MKKGLGGCWLRKRFNPAHVSTQRLPRLVFWFESLPPSYTPEGKMMIENLETGTVTNAYGCQNTAINLHSAPVTNAWFCKGEIIKHGLKPKHTNIEDLEDGPLYRVY